MEDLNRIYSAYTLVDITNTGVIRDLPGQELARNQQRNWETVLQCIGLTIQPNILNSPTCVEVADLSAMQFGEMYTGKHRVWHFTFSVDREDVFRRGTEDLAQLEENFDEVPIVPYLSETARFMLPIFYTSGAIKNIYFKIGLGMLNN
jgi:hypothetical protein